MRDALFCFLVFGIVIVFLVTSIWPVQEEDLGKLKDERFGDL